MSLSADGNTAIVGGFNDNSGAGAAWVFATPASGQTYSFTNFVGQPGIDGSNDGTGSAARFYNPYGVAVNSAGDMVVADTVNNTIRKVTAAGVVTTLAGSAGSWGSDDGTGSAARFYYPYSVAVDSAGNVFVADTFNCTIRKVTPAGVVTTLAGSAGLQGSDDGTGSAARFFYPTGVAVDSAGNVFVADSSNNTIRKVTAAGVVTTLAGSAGLQGSDDGTGSAARFSGPFGVAVDSAGNVFVADTYNYTIRKVTAAGVVTTVAGSAGLEGSADGTGSAARFFGPSGVAVDSAGNVFVAEAWNNTIRKVTSAGVVTTVAGSAGSAGSADGTGSAARFSSPFGVAVDSAGNVFVADSSNNRISKGTPNTVGLAASVTPYTTTSFGSILSGQTADRTFTVSNVGSSTLSGTASVSAPFSIVAGGSYTLAPGQSQTVTVRYSPTAAGTAAGYVTFTGVAGGVTRQVTGSAYTDPTATTGTIVGRVTRSDNGTPLNGVSITAVGPGSWFDNSAGAVSGVIAGQAGRFSISGLVPNAYYHVLASAPGQQYDLAELTGVNVQAGQTTTANIQLTPVPPAQQPPILTPEETPVVLVRGRGADKNWDAGESDYWAEVRTALVGQGFQHVWDCNQPDNDSGKNPSFPVYNGQGHVINGQNGIEDNAFGLQYFIRQKVQQFNRDKGYYPPSINIIAHSMGGLITRRAMGDFSLVDSNGKWVRIKVNKVVMLGTPNAGTPLADAAILNGVSFWPSQWDSTRDLKTHYIQAQFNPSYPWPSGVKLYLYAGTGGFLSGDPELYLFSGVIRDVQWLWPPEMENDGAVPRPSVSGVYHRRQGLQVTPISSFSYSHAVDTTDIEVAGGRLDHYGIKTDSATVNWVIGCLTNTATAAASSQLAGAGGAISAKTAPMLVSGQETLQTQQTGPTASTLSSATSDQVSAMSDVSAADSAVATNSLPMQQLEQTAGNLASGTTNQLSVVSDASTTLRFLMMTSETNVVFCLRDPLGTVIDSTTPLSNTNVQYSAFVGGSNTMAVTCTINNPAAGAWTAVADGTLMTATQATYSLMAFGDSNVALIPQTGPLFSQGQDVVVSCALADLGGNPATPVQNASIGAAVQLPDGTTTNLTLRDDGLHNDGAPLDGVYAAVLPNVQQPGEYSIFYQATAINSQSQAFQRVARGTFSVSSGHGSVWGDPVYENLDTDGDGIADLLQVKCWVNPTAAGNFILAGDLVDAGGTHRFSQSAQFSSDGSGASMTTLIFDLAEIRAGGGSGDYHIENLQLFEVTSTGTAWLDAYQGSSAVNIQAAPGSLQVTITPPEAVSAGAQWQVDGGVWQNSGGTVPGLLAGSHTVSYTNLTGWIKPADQIVQINDGATTITNGTYELTPVLLAAASRKVHGGAGTFDLNLTLDPLANPTVEPRKNGPNQLVFTFNKDMQALDGTLDVSEFTLTNATFVSAAIVSSNLTLNLTNVVDQSRVTVVMNGLSDLSDNALAGTNAVVVRSLYGDCNQTGNVSISDMQYVKNRLLQGLASTNYLADLNLTGNISISDMQQVKNNLLHTVIYGGFTPITLINPTLQYSITPTFALPPATLGEALGAPELEWSTNGDELWTPEIMADGSFAARSGSIGDLNVSWVETTVTGPGTLSFEWSVSSEFGGDFLTFALDGVDQPGRISGEVGWQTLTFTVPSGTHRLRWTYGKNGAASYGADAGWLRRVIYQRFP